MSNFLNWTHRTLLRACLALLVAVGFSALIAACARRSGASDACGLPGEGCPCDSPGETVPCAATVSMESEQYTCQTGVRSCGDNSSWGACTLSQSFKVMSGAPPLHTEGTGVATACTSNPCDPYCSVIPDNAIGMESGLVEVGPDGSISIAPGATGSGPGTGCSGLVCQIASCPSGGMTTVSGTVYAPNGTLPLYNVLVYVPNSTVSPLATGAVCDKCGSPVSGSPITTTLTDYKGNFTLNNVPSGANIPLVIQLGKWRRQVTIPNVTSCVNNVITDHNLTRLPKTQSEGNMPKIAVTTGDCDRLSCMLPKVGISSTEFGVQGSSKAVHFYSGAGLGQAYVDYYGSSYGYNMLSGGPSGMTTAKSLWTSLSLMMNYDIIVFSCECYEGTSGKGSSAYSAVTNYLAAGGRVFSTDFQYVWYKYSTDSALSGIATIPGGAPTGGSPVYIDTSFPKGAALSSWLEYIDSSTGTSSPAHVTPSYVFANFNTLNSTATAAQRWGYSSGSSNPRFLTVNTPAGAAAASQCGKAVHLDAHINQFDTVDSTFPAGCSGSIGQGEEAFAFFFFDIASCVSPTSTPPPTPPPYQNPITISRQYQATCAVGQSPVWRFFDWKTVTPSDTSIVFSAQTASTVAGLSGAVPAPLGSASGASITTWVGTDVSGALASLVPKQTSQTYLQVNITLNPSSDHNSTPTLTAWQQTYDCIATE